MREFFVYTSLPTRVLFDAEASQAVAREAERLGLRRVLLVRAPGHRSAAVVAGMARGLGDRLVGAFAEAAPHVPAAVLRACRAAHSEFAADGLLAVGGGSAIGLGKLVAAETRTPLIAVPTTYSGAEMTPFNAVTENGAKVQRRDLAMLPASVIYDPELTLELPLSISGPSMMNAIAHSVEAMYAPDTNPVVAAKADMSIRIGAAVLPSLAGKPSDRGARRELLLAAMLAGEVLAVTSMGLHHKLCHILGGHFGLPHADVNAVVLPYAMAYNAPGAPAVAARIADALGIADPAAGLRDLAASCGAPASLAALGLPETAVAAVAKMAARQNYANPMPLAEDGLRAMLSDAFAGRHPSVGAYQKG